VELVSLAQIERALGLLALATPLLGLLAAGIATRRARRDLLPHAIVAIGIGPMLWILWRATRGVQDRLGVDSVIALFLNFGIFIAVGLTAGIIWGRRGIRKASPRRHGDTEECTEKVLG
jgi:hypothetical protein